MQVEWRRNLSMKHHRDRTNPTARNLVRRGTSLFGWILIAIGVQLRRWRRRNDSNRRIPRSQVLQPDVTPSADTIAEAILARLAGLENNVRRRKVGVFVLMIVTSLLVGTVLITIRPAVRSSLAVSGPAAFHSLSITDAPGSHSLNGSAQLRTLDVEVLPASPEPEPGRLELVLPVPATLCATLATRIGGACGPHRPASTDRGTSLDITSTGTAELTLTTHAMRSLSIEGNATTNAILQIATSAVTTATFRCKTPGARVVLTASGQRFDLERRCGSEPTRDLRVLLQYDALPELTLVDLGSLTFLAPGRSATLSTTQAVVSVAGNQHVVQRPIPFTVTVRSSLTTHPTFAFNSVRGVPGPYVLLTADRASSVRIARGREEVPTEFAKHPGPLYALAGVIAGLLLSAAFELFTRRGSII
jgi:hypothetical protein